jgi:hypothetical protein
VTVLAAERARSVEKFTYRVFSLASGNKGWKGGIACADLSTGKVEPGHDETDLFAIGVFDETVDATAAEKLINVNLGREVIAEWLANATAGDAVAAADVFNLCYVMDDQTVTKTSTGRSVAGRVWAIDATRGVLVERLAAIPTPSTSMDGLEMLETAAPAFVSNDSVLGANPNSGAIYDVPTTAAASTITLPATAVEGTFLTFVADGTKNAHTVQYRDATGPANLTTALTAAKRHQVHATFLNGKWYANAYVSP